jgi:hypothetical protein
MTAHPETRPAPAQPTVAVITVCRNVLPDLKMTAASVKGQRCDNVLHVVVDGGSSDGSAEWLLANRADFAVAVSEPDKGIYDAMNKALRLCPDADWIIFMNAGDVFNHAQVIDTLADDLRRTDVDFLFGGVEIREAGGAGRAKTYPPRRHARTDMPGCHQSCFVRATLMKRLKFDLTYKVAGDFECWLRATAAAESKTGLVNATIATIAPEGYSAQNEPVLQENYFRAIDSHLSRREAIVWLLKRKIRRVLLTARTLLTPTT